MKKIMSFLKSMKFGMVLLILIILCSLAGSLIPQQRQAMEYVQRYGATAAQAVLALRLDDVFSAPYFIVLMAALCLNLTLCSILRFRRTLGAGRRLRQQAMDAQVTDPLAPEKARALEEFLARRHFKAQGGQGKKVYCRGMAGYYGSFLTHLSILLVLAVGAAVVVFAQVWDETVMPGETLTLADGTQVQVDRFQIEDETGALDYASNLTVTSGDGKTQAQGLIRVNQPMRFGDYKIYQQTYGTAGSVRIYNAQNGGSETIALTDACFLTLDGVDGLFFQALYPGYVTAADGSVTLITSTAGAYTDPVYDIRSISEGVTTPLLAFPGETLTIGDVSFTFLDPVSYPGLRIKHMSGGLLGLLYGVFALMVAALYLCFFMTPACVLVTDEGYALVSPKQQTGLMLDIKAELGEEE